MQMFNRKGQNIAEYSILIALVVAAAVAMQVYVKRGVQGRIADATDMAPPTTATTNIGGKDMVFNTKQYEPYYLESSADVSSSRDLTEDYGASGATNRTNINETTIRGIGAIDKTTFNNAINRDPNRPDRS